MVTVGSCRHGADHGIPRAFVDVTTSFMLAGEPSVGVARVEAEIARRLLASADLRPIPVVFRQDGTLFALTPGQVERIFAARPSVESQEIPFPNQCPSATVPEELIV